VSDAHDHPEPEAVPGDDPEQARRTLDAVTGQLEWVQGRLDDLDAAAAAAATALAEPPPSG
jgi:hypothetical protein